ncbi:unnamed protein product, partial [marine sediment metagenome]
GNKMAVIAYRITLTNFLTLKLFSTTRTEFIFIKVRW